MPNTKPNASLSPGLYQVAGRQYLVRADAVRMVRRNGQPSRYILARIAGPGLQVVVGSSRSAQVAMHALATGQAAQVEAHCHRCNRLLSDPESVAAGIGPECAKAVA
jgi:hypothetical protein